MMDLRPAKDEPVTLGHEGVGYIESIHPSAEGKGFKVGDAIGFLYIVGCCYECEGCMIHNLHCTSGKQLLQGFMTDGFFAEYAVVDWQNAIVLPKNLAVERCAPLFCAGITGKRPFTTIPWCLLTYFPKHFTPSTAVSSSPVSGSPSSVAAASANWQHSTPKPWGSKSSV